MNKVMSNRLHIALYILPAFLLIIVLIFIPLFLTGYYGLMDWDGIGAMKFIGLENYINGIKDLKVLEQCLSFIFTSNFLDTKLGNLFIGFINTGFENKRR